VTSGGILSASLLLQLVRPEMDDLARKYEFVQNVFEVKLFVQNAFLARKYEFVQNVFEVKLFAPNAC
jgi:hypothetical protein